MDNFAEQIVVKQTTAGDIVKKIAIGAAALILSALLFLVTWIFGIWQIGILLAAGCIYGGYYIFTGFDIEYEYIVTNGEIDVDKIIAKRKRKRMLTVKASTFEDFGIITEAPEKDGLTVFMVTGIGESDYYADFKHEKHGMCRLVFSPNEKIRTAFEPFLRLKKK